ncbi:MAG TPA: S46 family peptidase [Polyangiaceae bacterium]|nr:S46 family peptidase [Polyangiaceae bacterium]
MSAGAARRRRRFAWAAFAASLVSGAARADEGMWPPDMVPRARIEQERHVALTDAWLDHVRLASVRFNVGGSGSFVSPRGLVLTNHHVAGDCVAKLASPGHDYLAAGYLAGRDGPEIACPDLELDQLLSIDDVTARVQAAGAPAGGPPLSDADANRATKAAMGQIEKECHDRTGLRCDVVTFYGGAMYRLYRYRRYTDVRLVFAPEADVAFFGGDPDNFTFPRYDLDLAIFRVYEAGRPLAPADWLRWDPRGPVEGEVVFTSGNPARTSRNATLSELEALRDVVYPGTLARLSAWREGLGRWASQGPEEKRQAREAIFGVDNSRKAVTGYERGLGDAALLRKKREREQQLRGAVDASPALKDRYGGVWDAVARAQAVYARMYPTYAALEAGLGGALLRDARALVRLPAERALPNEQRMPEYRETALDELSMHVLSPAPIYPGVEQAFVAQWLSALLAALGPQDPAVGQVLAGRPAERAAREIVATTRLYDVYARRALWDGGAAAVAASTDPLVAAMRAVDPTARAARKRYEDEVEAPMRSLGRRVAEATFAVEGTRLAPDATFTLRLSVGVVKGYVEQGRRIAFTTDFAGMYRHATGVEPLALPERWLAAKDRLSPDTALDFVSTNDIIGGNSGSPVVDASGALVGLVFDGNLASLPNRFIYDETTARAVSVATAAMTEALRVVYGADALVDELSPRSGPAGKANAP